MILKIFGPKIRNLWLALFVTVIIVFFDQWLKRIAVAHLKGAIAHIYWQGFVVIEYAENRGAFLSLGANLSDTARLWIFVIGVIGILIFCLYSLWQSLSHTLMTLSYAAVIAGGLGNLIDRIQQGYVVDYIHMGFGSLRTGVFNLADVAISTGLIVLVILQYLVPAEKSKEK